MSSVGRRQEPKIVLPDIKMRPKEMLTISRVLSRCDPLAQVVFITLMENWSRAGFEVAIPAQSIVLDAPCGEGVSTIAVFRKGRPTIAIRQTEEYSRALCALCLHPIGYYGDTWAGAMCPTDEVIAHLLMMRGSEEKYWANANQHPVDRPAAGV